MPDTTTTPDPITACLDDAKKRYGAFGESDAMPRLLAALDAVLAMHHPVPQNLTTVCPHHAGGGRGRKSLAAYRDEVQECPACHKETVTVCSHCECPHDEWPCPTYRAISAELLGEVPTDG